jgi:hypothetical protein
MKIFIRLILVALASWMMIMTSCKKDNNDNPPEDQYTLVASQLIGPAGGTISTNDVILSVPANAVTYAVTLEIYSSTTENPFGDEGNSSVFWIKGLPDVLLSPVKLSVKYSGTLSDQSFIALGKYVIATSGADTTVSQDLLPATDSSGYLKAIIPAGQVKLLKSTNYTGKYGIPFWSISSYWYYQTDHFLIHFPGKFKSTGSVEALADGLEGGYQKLYDMGFRYDARTSWPLEVTVKTLDPDVDGQTDRSFPWTANSGYIEVNSLKMSDKALMKITGGHEFFHIVQDLYNSDEKYNWLQEASSVWFEEKLDANPATYVSAARQGHELEPFSGLQAGATGSQTHHGYGCSAVIKYLVSQYGEDIIKKIWEDCRDQSSHPVEAIKKATDPVVIWWSNFMREYTLGHVYSDMSVAQAVYNEKFTISSDQTTQKAFDRAFPDISGYIYVIEPTNPNFKDTDQLQLTLTGEGRSMYALKKTGSEVTSIGFNVDQIVIPDLKGLKASASSLYILVMNYNDTPPTYTATSNLHLDAQVIGGSLYNYIDNYESQFKTVAIGMDGTIPRFLVDVKCEITSPAQDFRVSSDSAWFNNEYRWFELRYTRPSESFTRTVQVSVTSENLRKNPATTYNWDNPTFGQLHLYISDKNGQKDYYFDNTGNCTFNIEWDQDNIWPFCMVYVDVKDPVNQFNTCNAIFFSLAVYTENK